MKYLVTLIICISSFAHAGVGSFAVGYIIGKSGKKTTHVTSQKNVSEIEELKNKIIGYSMNRGWAFQFEDNDMVVKIDLSNYDPKLVLKVFNDLKNDKYPVSIKNGVMIFNWKKDYCENYEEEKPLRYSSLLKQVADVSLIQAYHYLNCPFLQSLSKYQREELLGEDFKTGSYIIGGGSWVGYESTYKEHRNSYKDIETKTQELKAVAEKFCNIRFKDTTSKVLSYVFPLKESYFVKDESFKVKIKDIKYSYKKVCGEKS